jgi:hypothetical protein
LPRAGGRGNFVIERDDGSEASASSEVPLSETPTLRGTILQAASEPRI